MRKITSQCRQCRRESQKLFLKGEKCNSPKCPMVKKPYIPGFHGPKRRMSKLSIYGQQLREKQKAKRIYGLLEKPFANLMVKVSKLSGNAGDNLLIALEFRFDNVIHRLKLANSRNSAKQLISHGHFQVNGQNVDISSYAIKTGDKITVKANKSKDAYWEKVKQTLTSTKDVPGWLSLDVKKLEAQVVGQPEIDAIKKDIDTTLIIEFYSR